jgi:hypothetical protein
VPQQATKWFAGIVRAAGSTETALVLHNAIGNVEAQAYVFKLIDTKRYRNKTPGSAASFEKWIELPKTDFPANADLMKVTLIYKFTDFADTKKWQFKDLVFAYLYDTNVDSKGGARRLSNDPKFGTTTELAVSRPNEKFLGTPKVRILNIGSGAGGPADVPFELIVRFYQRVGWDWISSLQVSGTSINARLTVPEGTPPGVYDGLVLVTAGDLKTVVPVSVLVPIVSAGQYGGQVGGSPYDNYAVYGAFDWGWRYESGDWRTYALVVDNPNAKVTLSVSWTDSRTDIDLHLTGLTGYLVASSEFPRSQYAGSGRFYWRTVTGGSTDEIFLEPVQPGIYMLVLHNVLLGVSSFDIYPEPFTFTVQFG